MAETLPPHLHHSWLSVWVQSDPTAHPLRVDMESVAHTVSLTCRGRHRVRWSCRRREQTWDEAAGCVNFTPATGEQNSFLTTPSADFASVVLVIPRSHLGHLLASEGCDPPGEFHHLTVAADPVLQRCLRQLTVTAAEAPAGDCRRDEAARRLVLRLAECSGTRPPEWFADEGSFDRRSLEMLVGEIDSVLDRGPRLSDLALLVGLSPSHFAHKFRISTGFSLGRLVQYRRVQAALVGLRDRNCSVSQLALKLGFSSRSHFSRIFRQHTGLTPTAYRRLF